MAHLSLSVIFGFHHLAHAPVIKWVDSMATGHPTILPFQKVHQVKTIFKILKTLFACFTVLALIGIHSLALPDGSKAVVDILALAPHYTSSRYILHHPTLTTIQKKFYSKIPLIKL